MHFKIFIFLLLAQTSLTIAKNLEKKHKCEANICGPHSKCIDNEDDKIYSKLKEPYCLCEPKTIGKPPNCTLGCLKNSECNSDEFCDLKTKKCTKVCLDQETCNSTDGCHENTKKLCLGRCRDDDDCKSKEVCDIYHKCVDGCRSDNDCKDSEFCNENQKCADVCAKSNCGDNSICNGYNHVQHCACAEGYFPEKGVGCKLKEDDHAFIELDEDRCHTFCGDFASCIIEDDIVHCYCPRDIESNPIIACPPPLIEFGKPAKPTYCECCEQAIDPDCAVPISCAIDADCLE